MQLNDNFVKILVPTIKTLLKFEEHADKLVTELLSTNRKFAALEKKTAVDTIYTILRNYYKITQIIKRDNILDIIGITWVKLLQLAPETYSKIKTIDFNKLGQLEFLTDELSVYELPQFILDKLKTEYPNNYKEIIEALNKRAPIDIRVNTQKVKIPQVIDILNADKINYSIGKFSPYAIRLDQQISPKHKLIMDGMVEFQDESSQLATLSLAPKRGSLVVDFCAGSGGKSLFLGMLMRDSGRIYAFDTNMRRLNNLSPRLLKSGLKNIYPELIAHENDAKVKRFYNKIDYVFVDAPCSGLGTLARHPELKFTLNEEKLQQLITQQFNILEAASKLLKPGGILVYATCSILPEENQDIINKFLRENTNFTHVNAREILPNCEELVDTAGNLTIQPGKDAGSGFFAARLQKQ